MNIKDKVQNLYSDDSTKGNFKRGFSKGTGNSRVGACLKIKGLKNIFAPAIQNEGLYFPK